MYLYIFTLHIFKIEDRLFSADSIGSGDPLTQLLNTGILIALSGQNLYQKSYSPYRCNLR